MIRCLSANITIQPEDRTAIVVTTFSNIWHEESKMLVEKKCTWLCQSCE